MADPISMAVGYGFYALVKKGISEVGKMVINKQVDRYMLQQFIDQYERLPDKRRRPGPKLRKVISVLQSGEMEMARDELKELAHECLGLNAEPEWLEVGQMLLNMLEFCP
jgi:hypothetical protein